MFILGVQAADWGMMAFCGMSCPLVFRIEHHVFPHVPCTVDRVSNTLGQATPGVDSVNFWSFTVAWTWGGGEDPPTSDVYLSRTQPSPITLQCPTVAASLFMIAALSWNCVWPTNCSDAFTCFHPLG